MLDVLLPGVPSTNILLDKLNLISQDTKCSLLRSVGQSYIEECGLLHRISLLWVRTTRCSRLGGGVGVTPPIVVFIAEVR